MPELPEVEVVRRGLHRHIRGRTIRSVEVLSSRASRRSSLGLAETLPGRTPVAVERRGKFLWAVLDDGDVAITMHLGMSGQLLLGNPGERGARHLRVRIGFDDSDRELHFVDQRTFGWLAVEAMTQDDRGRTVPVSARHIAPDPFEEAYDPDEVVRRIRRRRSEIKRALLDQTLISGIGNIYADEALWRARVHGRRRTSAIPTSRVLDVLESAHHVMTDALAQGGTSFDDLYVNVNGESGYFERWLEAYGQAGEPCSRCGTQIRREHFMNRSSYFCPRCQCVPRRVRPRGPATG